MKTSTNPPSVSVGRFWEIDANGFILNDASRQKITPIYQPSIAVLTDAYRTHLGDALHSVYVRGTVPRGMAIPGISDLDSFAVVIAGATTSDLSWAAPAEQQIIESCPALTGVSFESWLISDVMAPTGKCEMPFVLKTQAVCVLGDDLSHQFPKYRPDATVAAIDLSQIQADIEEATTAISSATISHEQVRYWCRRIMKNIIRAGFCLTMENEHSFTRDLPLCIQSFVRHYPEKAPEMNRALQFFLDPTPDLGELQHFLDNFGCWLIHEADT